MNGRAEAFAPAIMLTLAIGVWLLAQIMLSAEAGRQVADVAVQGARVLPLTQLIVASLAVPWIGRAAPGAAVIRPLLWFVLIPLPLQTLVVLAGPIPLQGAAAALAGVLAWSAALAGLTALIGQSARFMRAAPYALTLVQIGALVLVWRFGNGMLDFAGIP